MNKMTTLLDSSNNITLEKGDKLADVLKRLNLYEHNTRVVRKKAFTDRDSAIQFLETKRKSAALADKNLAVSVMLPDTPEYLEAQRSIAALIERIELMPQSWSTNRQRQFSTMLEELTRIFQMEHNASMESRINYWMILFYDDDSNSARVHQAHPQRTDKRKHSQAFAR